MTRIIGSNKHGNQNELIIVEALNNKTFSQLNNNLKEFIKYISIDNNIHITNNTYIKAEYEPKQLLKQDIYIYINNQKFFVSCKQGSGNSVHQEKCEDFIFYIKSALNADENICDYFRLFLWADGTKDGTGPLLKDSDNNIISRMSAGEFREKYPHESKEIKKFLKKNEYELIKRFLFVGRHNSHVDYIYHGTSLNGRWISAEEIIRINLDLPLKDKFNVGKLTLQAWNISRKGRTEKKRGQLQVKYGGMKKDIFSLMKKNCENLDTFFGDKEEFELSAKFNKNKHLAQWNIMTIDIKNLDDIYMVKVSEKPISKLSNKKVFPKADAYLVKAAITRELLLENEFTLNEHNLKDIDYEFLSNTGISIKMKDSKKYTIQKLTFESFKKAFKNLVKNESFVFAALMLYSTESDMHKNKKILKDLSIDLTEFKLYYQKELTINIDISQSKDIDKIRKHAQKITKSAIKNNLELYESIFSGKYWFDEPYIANFIYKNNELSHNILIDFTITTGSGRSKGNYSIEIKPK